MPGYRIPSRERVRDALRRVLARQKRISSQRQLKELLEREMANEEDYRVSGPRARDVAFESGLVEMEVECRETEERGGLHRCPVCRTRLERVKNRTVFGGTVTLGYDCPRCPYWTGLRRRVPTRYIFTRRAE